MSAQDVLMIGVLIFAFGLGFFVVNFMMDQVVTEMVAVPAINASNASVVAIESMQTTAARLDYVIFGLFIGLLLGLIITSWFIGGNPLFIFIYFIVWMIAVVISTVLSNTWETVTSMAIFGTTIVDFPLTNNLIAYLPIYIAVVGFIGFVIMFAKPYVQGE